MKVGLVCCARLENRYAVEFVEYYKKLGFDHIFICDNNYDGEEYFEDVLQQYIDEDFVTIYCFRNELKPQRIAYNELYFDISEDMDFDWLFFCDFDEFLILKQDNNIKEYLSRNCFKDYNQILINWKIYSDNDLIYDDGRSCLERFTKESKILDYWEYDYNNVVKCFIRTKINNVKNYTHLFDNDILKLTTCNNKGDRCELFFKQQKNYELSYIKHFITKTIDEYTKLKMFKGGGDEEIINYNIDKFFLYNEITSEKTKYLLNNYYNRK